MEFHIHQHHKGPRVRPLRAVLRNIIPLFRQSACIPKVTEATDTRAMTDIRAIITVLDTLHREEVLLVIGTTMTRRKDIDLDRRDPPPRDCDLHIRVTRQAIAVVVDGETMHIQAVVVAPRAHQVPMGPLDLHLLNHVKEMLIHLRRRHLQLNQLAC